MDTTARGMLAAEGSSLIATHCAPVATAARKRHLTWRGAPTASGRGVLRGDVDLFSARLRKAATVEEHIQLSVF